MAEAYYNHFTQSNNASSAGVLDYTPEKYGHPVKEVVEIMQEEGIDVSKQKVKFLTKEMIKENDKIFIMCKEEQCPHFLSNSNKNVFWEVSDPFDTKLENYRKIRDEIKAKVLSIL